VRGPRYSVLGTWVDAVDPASALREIAAWLAGGLGGYVCVANVHAVMEALRDDRFRHVYNQAGLIVPDGMPLVWVGRLRGHAGVRRVYGPDLMLELCGRLARAGRSAFFYGGSPGVAAELAERLCARFPGLRCAGSHSPPFRALSASEEEDVVRLLNTAGPDVIFVGLGCPRQEKWMAALRDRLCAPVLVGVGAAFDFHTGRVPQAPRWMQSAGLEWLFRLAQEPSRLWRRYLVYNPLFIFHVTLQLLGLRRYPPLTPPAILARPRWLSTPPPPPDPP
jgi:N-acetylglucosaminyldiphosphoundecaprenol N-acetyl-beta-D-mannosaminyltransferase